MNGKFHKLEKKGQETRPGYTVYVNHDVLDAYNDQMRKDGIYDTESTCIYDTSKPYNNYYDIIGKKKG